MPPRTPVRGGSGDPWRDGIGDLAQRVTVPLPQSLQDLESTAKKSFGNGARFKMYHCPGQDRSRKPDLVETQAQFQNICHDDLVVLRRESAESGTTYPRDMTTTHMSAYVKHPIEQRMPPEAPQQQRPDMKQPTFQGRSCYTGDYVEHPVEQRVQKGSPAGAWEPNNVPMNSRSTYAENFPWHPSQPKPPSGRPRDGARNDGAAPPPFNGASSYTLDYVKHPHQRPKSATGPRRKGEQDPGAAMPFSGTTTYTTDYKKHPNSPTKRSPGGSPWKQESGPSPAFQGTSEYQMEYIKKERARQALVHLEPHAKDKGRSGRSGSSAR